jgi:Mg2+-importing ATPase
MLDFVAETYDSIALIRTNAFGFVRLIGLHLSALLLDCVGLTLLCVALGFHPDFLLVLLGYSLAYVIAAVSSLPGGGGSFEAAMAVTFTQLGVPGHLALSVTLLYRLMTFWLPLLPVAFTANSIRAPRPRQPASRLRPVPERT